MSRYSATAVNISLPFSASYVCQQAVLFLTNIKRKILMFDILMYKKFNTKQDRNIAAVFSYSAK